MHPLCHAAHADPLAYRTPSPAPLLDAAPQTPLLPLCLRHICLLSLDPLVPYIST